MNAWFRISKFIFKLLIALCLFLFGALTGSIISANWKFFVIIAIVSTVIITLAWFVGRLSLSQTKKNTEIPKNKA